MNRLSSLRSKIYSALVTCSVLLNGSLCAAETVNITPTTVQIVNFIENKSPPKLIIDHYHQLISDLDATGDGKPTFYTSKYSINSDTEAVFVKVVSNLTQGSHGHQIELFSLDADKIRLLFSVVSNNIAVVESEQVVASGIDHLPSLVTDFPEPVRAKNVGKPTVLTSGTIWKWNGDKYTKISQ